MAFTLQVNKDGNGACPLCSKKEDCFLIRKMTEAIKDMYKEGEMEIVIYKCFRFGED